MGANIGALTSLIHGYFLNTGTFLLAELYGSSAGNSTVCAPLSDMICMDRPPSSNYAQSMSTSADTEYNILTEIPDAQQNRLHFVETDVEGGRSGGG